MKQSKQDNVYFFWSASILLCMLIAVFVLGFTSCQGGAKKAAAVSPSPAQAAAAPSASPPASPQVPAGPTRLAQTDDMGQAYVDQFVFLGDSTTYGLGRYNVVGPNQVWTPKSGTLTLALWDTATIVYPEEKTEISIAEAVAKKKPAYMLVTLGVNGVSFMDEDTFTKTYTALVNTIKQQSSDTKIILNSIYPIAVADYSGITNEKINAANTWIETLAADTGVRYLDSESAIKDSTGAMPVDISNDKKLHMNEKGYERVINYLRTHGYK